MKKVLELIIHKKSWGATSGDVLLEAYNAISRLNSPAPFEIEPDLPDMNALANCMKEACDNATAGRRKGMMISSRFRVENPNFYTVMVKHVLNEHDPELFLTFKRTLTEAEFARIEGAETPG